MRGLATRIPACIASVFQFRKVVRLSVVPMRTLRRPGLTRVSRSGRRNVSAIGLTVAIETSVCDGNRGSCFIFQHLRIVTLRNVRSTSPGQVLAPHEGGTSFHARSKLLNPPRDGLVGSLDLVPFPLTSVPELAARFLADGLGLRYG